MFVLITGVQASGKSTIAQAVAERLPRSVHVRGDVFRRMVINGRAEMAAGPSTEALCQLRLRYELAVDVADRYVHAGFATVMQDVVLGAELGRVLDRVRSRPRNLIVLAPETDIVRARDAHRQHMRGKLAYRPEGLQVDDLDSILRTETPRIGHWLDSSRLSVEQTTDAVLAALGTSALVP